METFLKDFQSVCLCTDRFVYLLCFLQIERFKKTKMLSKTTEKILRYSICVSVYLCNLSVCLCRGTEIPVERSSCLWATLFMVQPWTILNSVSKKGLCRTRKLRQCTNWNVNLQICKLAKASSITNWSVQLVCRNLYTLNCILRFAF